MEHGPCAPLGHAAPTTCRLGWARWLAGWASQRNPGEAATDAWARLDEVKLAPTEPMAARLEQRCGERHGSRLNHWRIATRGERPTADDRPRLTIAAIPRWKRPFPGSGGRGGR